MEKKLKALFDYQRFAKNEKIEQMAKETEQKHKKNLSDEDLTEVYAAGDLTEKPKNNGTPIDDGNK